MNYNQLMRRHARLQQLLTVIENSPEYGRGMIAMATVELCEVINETLAAAQAADHHQTLRITAEVSGQPLRLLTPEGERE